MDRNKRKMSEEEIDANIAGSFPASDPPSWTLGLDEPKQEGVPMKVKEVMTSNPACCTPETNLQEVAKMMRECDCGEIPVVNNEKELKPLGVVTDRDIVCRTLAQGKDPLHMKAADCMSRPCVTINIDAMIEDCCRILSQNHIRRVPVVNQQGSCCGIVAQADLATHDLKDQVVAVLQRVSQKVR